MRTDHFLNLRTSFLIVALSLVFAVFSFSFVSAQNKAELCRGADLTFDDKVNCGTDAAGNPYAAGTGPQDKVNGLIAQIVNIFSIIVGIVAVIMIIVGGFKFITSSGDSAKVTSARNTILYALVGLIVVALAQFIVKFILNKIPA